MSRPDDGMAWALWIAATVVGVVLAGLVSWPLRLLVGHASLPAQQLFAYGTVLESGLIVASAQWLVLRHYRLDAPWWVPVSAVAYVLVAATVGPIVIRLAFAGAVFLPITAARWQLFEILSSATSGIVVGTAQAILLQRVAGRVAWAWVPASALGGVLAAAATHILSLPMVAAAFLFGTLATGLIVLVGAAGALVASACQASVLMLILWRRRA